MSSQVEECSHPICYKGTHPSFKKGKWLCADCGQQIDLGKLQEYAVVFAAMKVKSKAV